MINKECPCSHCGKDCPFLEVNYLQATNKIPYYCGLFSTFLGFDGSVLRCSECLGQQQSVREEGLNFINAFYSKGISRTSTKMTFSKLLPKMQAQFVNFLKRFGKPVALPAQLEQTKQVNLLDLQKNLIAQMQVAKTELKEADKPLELQEIISKLTTSTTTDVSPAVSKLITGLFMFFDSTERDMLLQVLKNPHTLNVFLQKLKFMPKDKNFLTSLKRELETLLPEAQKHNKAIYTARNLTFLKTGILENTKC